MITTYKSIIINIYVQKGDDMQFCKKCGSELKGGAEYCSQCGMKIEEMIPQINAEQKE